MFMMEKSKGSEVMRGLSHGRAFATEPYKQKTNSHGTCR